MAIPARPCRGGIRCTVARDVADELERIAGECERRARQETHEDNRRSAWLEAAVLRTVVLAVRRINLQE